MEASPIDYDPISPEEESLGRECAPEEKQELIDGMRAQAEEWKEHLATLIQQLHALQEDAEAHADEIARIEGEMQEAEMQIEGLQEYVEAAEQQAVYTKPHNPESGE